VIDQNLAKIPSFHTTHRFQYLVYSTLDHS